MTMRLLIRLICAGVMLGACTVGVVEFQYYREAFETQYAEGGKVLDRLGTAERTLVARRTSRQGATRDFDPDAAAYELAVGDPPLTEAIRASLDSLRTYNDTLTGLSSGESAAAMSARLGSSTTALTQALSGIGGAAGLDLGITASVQTAIGPALQVMKQLSVIRNRVEFRRQLLVGYPDMRALMTTLRAGTPDMFEVIKRSYVKRGSLGGGTTDGIPNARLDALDADRKLLAGWVILIDRTLIAMDAAVLVLSEGGTDADLAGLVEATVEIRALADTIRAVRVAPN
jgi:hypothetical protein